jgi:hypothetical protein
MAGSKSALLFEGIAYARVHSNFTLLSGERRPRGRLSFYVDCKAGGSDCPTANELEHYTNERKRSFVMTSPPLMPNQALQG